MLLSAMPMLPGPGVCAPLDWIAPPVQLAVVVHVPPLPVTTRAPFELEVLFRLIPGFAWFDEILWNERSLLPMVVLLTFSAVPEPVSIVFVFGLDGVVTVTVPPPVATKPLPVELVMLSFPPENVIVCPVLPVAETPSPATV